MELMERGPCIAPALSGQTEALVNGVLLLAAAVVVGAVVMLARRRLLQRHREPPGFSMERLAELRRTGQITDEEYSRLRRLILGLDAGAKRGDTPPSGQRDSSLSGDGRNVDAEDGEEDGPQPR